MGPRSFDRGNHAIVKELHHRRDPASMGPRSFDRGNVPVGRTAGGGPVTLQWGRGLLTAETGLIDDYTGAWGDRFNGAAVF